MEGIELCCFQIITYAGESRSKYILAMRKARKGLLEEAEELICEGKKNFTEAHKSHLRLLSSEQCINTVNENMLLLHAEDQLMSAETLGIVALELIEMQKEINDLKGKKGEFA